MDLERFNNILISNCKLNYSLPVLAGVSGGPDSLCMLDLLKRSGIPTYVVHINHQLREEADAEADKVKAYCDLKQLDCFVIKGDIKEMVKQERLSIEEAARSFRYTKLFEYAEKYQAQAVLVAHNAEDQVETVLMHFLRGSGTRGLRGMSMYSLPHPWSDRIPLVRPLLTTSREEVLNYCEEQHLEPSHDSSNQDTHFFRNRIRVELIPQLQSYNPEIKQRIKNLAEIVKVEDEFFTQQSMHAWQACILHEGSSYVCLDLSRFLQLHPALRKRIFLLATQKIAPRLRDLDFSAMERAISFAEKKGGRNHLLLLADIRITKAFHRELVISRGDEYLSTSWPQLCEQNLRRSLLEGQNEVGNGWWISCRQVEELRAVSADKSICNMNGLMLDGAILDTFKPGDVISPFGLGGKAMKLGNYWTNQGLPEAARKMWPLVRSKNGEVLWVVGMEISHHARINADTDLIHELSLIHNPVQA